MSERATVFQQTQLGIESVLGTVVPANRLILSGSIQPTPDGFPTPYRTMSSKVPSQVIKQKESVTGALDAVMDYNAIIYWLQGYLSTGVISTPTGATNTRRHTYLPLTRAADNAVSYTLDFGSSARAERMAGVKINSLTATWSDEEASLTGDVFGMRMTESVTITASPTEIPAFPVSPTEIDVYVGAATGTSEVQTVTVTGTPTGGSFKLTYAGQETASIAFDAAAATVQTALQNLSTIGMNNATVTGGPGPGTPWVVTFAAALAGIDTFLLTLSTNALTGGTSPTVTIVETTPGGLLHVGVPSRAELSLPERYVPRRTLRTADPSYSYFVEQGFEPTLTLDMPHNAKAAGYMANLRAADVLFCRVQAFGPATETGWRHRLAVTFPFHFTGADRGDADGVQQSTFTLALMHNTTFGGWIEVVVDNLLTAL
jgi:hypothetical protein